MSLALRSFALAAVTTLGMALSGCAADTDSSGDDEAAPQSTEDELGSCKRCTIVVEKSIGGVSLGMTEEQVKRVLGHQPNILSPSRARTPGGHAAVYTYFYGSPVNYQTIWFQDGKVDRILTVYRGFKTASGIGVGSTLTQLKAKFPNVRALHYGYGIGDDPDVTTTFEVDDHGIIDGIVIGHFYY